MAKFIKENDLKDIRIVGYELLKQNLEYLNDGVIDFLIHQKPEDQGYMGITHLYKKSVLKEPVEDLHYMPLEITRAGKLYDKKIGTLLRNRKE